MPTYPVVTKFINHSEISPGLVINENINFQSSNRSLIKGAVKDENGDPLVDIAVEVYLIDSSGNKNILGVVFTEAQGIYGVSVAVVPNCKYGFSAYSKLS